ncbi:MAG: alpha/beta hydrolase [Mycobacterium sp.]
MNPTDDSLRVAGPTGDLSVTLAGSPGARGAVVLLHPMNTAAVVWQAVLPLLNGPAVAIDLRGHGGSGRVGPFGVEDYVADVLAVLDELRLETVHLAGGSLGGSISVALAALHPERVEGVTTFGSTLGTGVPEAAIGAMVDELTSVGASRYFTELVPAVVGPSHRDAPGLAETVVAAAGRPESVIEEILRAAFGADIRHLAGAVRAPVLAVGGTADPTCPPAMTREIAEATGGSTVLLDGVGHLPMVEVPEQVAELIDNHMKTVTQEGP